jgi:hypothetical protein
MESKERDTESLSYDEPLPTPLRQLVRTLEVHLLAGRKEHAVHVLQAADLEAILRESAAPEPEATVEPTEAEIIEVIREHPRATHKRIAASLKCKVAAVVAARKAYAASRHKERLAYMREQNRERRKGAR